MQKLPQLGQSEKSIKKVLKEVQKVYVTREEYKQKQKNKTVVSVGEVFQKRPTGNPFHLS